jgi:hypothetical protein
MPNWIPITPENRGTVKGWVDKARPGVSIAFKRPGRRTLDQNSLMWPMLRSIQKHMHEWEGRELSLEQWKELFMGSLWGAFSVPGIHGGIVHIGSRHSSSLSKDEMSELLESIIAFAVERGIDLNDGAEPAQEAAQ